MLAAGLFWANSDSAFFRFLALFWANPEKASASGKRTFSFRLFRFCVCKKANNLKDENCDLIEAQEVYTLFNFYYLLPGSSASVRFSAFAESRPPPKLVLFGEGLLRLCSFELFRLFGFLRAEQARGSQKKRRPFWLMWTDSLSRAKSFEKCRCGTT